MKKLKRIFAVFFCLLLAAGILGGCGKAASSSAPAPSALQSGNKPLKIVTTIFPEYDWVRQILGEHAKNVELTMLLDNGVDLHSYQPTADDIIKISDCDLFVYVGGESDGWVEDALKEATNKNMKVINLLDVLKDRKQCPVCRQRKDIITDIPTLPIAMCRIEACPIGMVSGSLFILIFKRVFWTK